VDDRVRTAPQEDELDLADMRRRLKAIFIGSMGNLVEWYDFYAYAAFSLYFAAAFFPGNDPVVQQLNAAVLFACGRSVAGSSATSPITLAAAWH
jgi:MHS family alpha-ketoglutarate permease-like MFS transporter